MLQVVKFYVSVCKHCKKEGIQSERKMVAFSVKTKSMAVVSVAEGVIDWSPPKPLHNNKTTDFPALPPYLFSSLLSLFQHFWQFRPELDIYRNYLSCGN